MFEKWLFAWIKGRKDCISMWNIFAWRWNVFYELVFGWISMDILRLCLFYSLHFWCHCVHPSAYITTSPPALSNPGRYIHVANMWINLKSRNLWMKKIFPVVYMHLSKSQSKWYVYLQQLGTYLYTAVENLVCSRQWLSTVAKIHVLFVRQC